MVESSWANETVCIWGASTGASEPSTSEIRATGDFGAGTTDGSSTSAALGR
jgi:hypothetical protein